MSLTVFRLPMQGRCVDLLLGALAAAVVTITIVQQHRPHLYFPHAFRYSRLQVTDGDAQAAAAEKSLARAPDLQRLNASHPDLLVTVITSLRKWTSHQYVHLTLWTLLQEARDAQNASPSTVRLRVLLCQTLHNSSIGRPDYLRRLRGRLPIVRRPFSHEANLLDVECSDYVFCLNRSLSAGKAPHILVLEDDAVLRRSEADAAFLPTLSFVIARAERHRRGVRPRSFAYLKLYHPTRLLGFLQPEWGRHAEALAIAALLWTAGRLLVLWWSRGQRRAVAVGSLRTFLLILALLYLLDRFWVLEVRGRWPWSHVVAPATFCCTPGILFPRRAAQEAARFMSGLACNASYRKDYALFDFGRRSGLAAWQVEPSLVQHAGRTSSLHLEAIDTWRL